MALLDSIANKPNPVLQQQVKFQNDPRPLFLRKAGRAWKIRTFGVVFVGTGIYATWGIYRLIAGPK